MDKNRIAERVVAGRTRTAQPGTTMNKAIAEARRMAKKTGETWFVVYEDGYHAADAEDLDTFFAGLDPVASVEPNGTVDRVASQGRTAAKDDEPQTPWDWFQANKATVVREVLANLKGYDPNIYVGDQMAAAAEILPAPWQLYRGDSNYVAINVKKSGWPDYEKVVAMAAKEANVPEEAVRDYYTEDMATEMFREETDKELDYLGDQHGLTVYRPGRSAGYVGIEYPADLLVVNEKAVEAIVKKALDESQDCLERNLDEDGWDDDDVIQTLIGCAEDALDVAGVEDLMVLDPAWERKLKAFASDLKQAIDYFEKPDRWAENIVANQWWNDPDDYTEEEDEDVTEASDRTAIAEALVDVAERIAAEGDKCGEKGCIRKSKDGWKVMSGKTGKLWPATYPTKKDAEDALASWHASRFKGAK